MDQHALGAVADIEVKIEIDIEFAGQGEDALDLGCGIAVVARRPAEHRRALLQRGDQ